MTHSATLWRVRSDACYASDVTSLVMRVFDTLMVCDAINIHLELTVTGSLPHVRNHFVITTGFVATKVAVTNTKCYGVDLLCKSKTEGAYAYAKRCDDDFVRNLMREKQIRESLPIYQPRASRLPGHRSTEINKTKKEGD